MKIEFSIVDKHGNTLHEYDDILENVPCHDTDSIDGGLSGFLHNYGDGIISIIHEKYEQDDNKISPDEFIKQNFSSTLVARATFSGGFTHTYTCEFYWMHSMTITLDGAEFDMDPFEILSDDPPTLLVQISSVKSKREGKMVVVLDEETDQWKECTVDYLSKKIKSEQFESEPAAACV